MPEFYLMEDMRVDGTEQFPLGPFPALGQTKSGIFALSPFAALAAIGSLWILDGTFVYGSLSVLDGAALLVLVDGTLILLIVWLAGSRIKDFRVGPFGVRVRYGARTERTCAIGWREITATAELRSWDLARPGSTSLLRYARTRQVAFTIASTPFFGPHWIRPDADGLDAVAQFTEVKIPDWRGRVRSTFGPVHLLASPP